MAAPESLTPTANPGPRSLTVTGSGTAAINAVYTYDDANDYWENAAASYRIFVGDGTNSPQIRDLIAGIQHEKVSSPTDKDVLGDYEAEDSTGTAAVAVTPPESLTP